MRTVNKDRRVSLLESPRVCSRKSYPTLNLSAESRVRGKGVRRAAICDRVHVRRAEEDRLRCTVYSEAEDDHFASERTARPCLPRHDAYITRPGRDSLKIRRSRV